MGNVFMATVNNQPVYWWIVDYDNNTGIATVWLNSPSPLINMYISRKGAPYNPISNSYCTTPYCPPYGGLSSFMNKVLGTNYNNGPSTFSTARYYGFTSANCPARNYNPLTLVTSPYGSSVTCSFQGISAQNIQATLGIHSGLIGQLLTVVPGSSLVFTFNVGITVTRGSTPLYSNTVPISLTMTYNQDGTENINSTVRNYIYLYLIRGAFSINYTGNLNVIYRRQRHRVQWSKAFSR
jgi:hypothetical protein